ncbi:MAG: RNA 2',3'-cyclic phosphodiesterase [Candidatus Nanoarchaeia archaeon]|jgi:2'-5' RNA ligase
MRCFIGIPLPEDVRRELVKAQACFNKVDARMSIVSLDNLHITLEFLGNVDDVNKIAESLVNVKFKPFKASLKNLSFFPKQDYIKVVHSPVVKGKSELISLYELIISSLSLERDERFSPHATLARVNFVKSTNALSRACFDVKFEKEFLVDSFNLYTSKLTPNGPVYTIIRSFK